jgi:hypothetical protein
MKSSMHSSSSTSLSSTVVPGSVAARLHEIYRECLEHSSWARIVLETSSERISFSCRKPPTAASSRKQGKKRPANAKRRERNRRRREEWLERRNNRSLTSPAPAAAAGLPAAAVPVPPTAADAAADYTAATAASYAAVAAVTAGSNCAVTDKAVAAEIATAPTPPPTKRPKVTAVATRASERLSVMANRRSIPQLDGCFSPSDSSFEAFSPAPAHPAPAPPDPASSATAPPPGYILCNICRTRHHDWVYSRCKHCKV